MRSHLALEELLPRVGPRPRSGSPAWRCSRRPARRWCCGARPRSSTRALQRGPHHGAAGRHRGAASPPRWWAPRPSRCRARMARGGARRSGRWCTSAAAPVRAAGGLGRACPSACSTPSATSAPSSPAEVRIARRAGAAGGRGLRRGALARARRSSPRWCWRAARAPSARRSSRRGARPPGAEPVVLLGPPGTGKRLFAPLHPRPLVARAGAAGDGGLPAAARRAWRRRCSAGRQRAGPAAAGLRAAARRRRHAAAAARARRCRARSPSGWRGCWRARCAPCAAGRARSRWTCG